MRLDRRVYLNYDQCKNNRNELQILPLYMNPELCMMHCEFPDSYHTNIFELCKNSVGAGVRYCGAGLGKNHNQIKYTILPQLFPQLTCCEH